MVYFGWPGWLKVRCSKGIACGALFAASPGFEQDGEYSFAVMVHEDRMAVHRLAASVQGE
jgi:hypothetical protein